MTSVRSGTYTAETVSASTANNGYLWTREQLEDGLAHGLPAWVVIQHVEDGALETTMANAGDIHTVTSEEVLDTLWPTLAFGYTLRWEDSLFRCDSLPADVEPMNVCASCE